MNAPSTNTVRNHVFLPMNKPLARRHEREPHADGAFFYAVPTTGVFCRPSCASRLPRRENVAFFKTIDAARAAGFRECKRCRPGGLPRELAIVERACAALDADPQQRLTLAQFSEAVHVSPFHLQRMFTRVVGVSPRQYQAARRGAALRDALQRGEDVTRATLDAGFGSPSRMYDSAPANWAWRRPRYRRKGAGLTVRYASAATPLGHVLVAATDKGICRIAFGDEAATLVDELRRVRQCGADRGRSAAAPFIAQIDAYLHGSASDFELPLDIAATAFHQRVWDALRHIPYGETRSYSRNRRSARLAARRAGRCERVRVESGGARDSLPSRRAEGRRAGGLSLGPPRKAALLDAEARHAVVSRTLTSACAPARTPAKGRPPPSWTTSLEHARLPSPHSSCRSRRPTTGRAYCASSRTRDAGRRSRRRGRLSPRDRMGRRQRHADACAPSAQTLRRRERRRRREPAHRRARRTWRGCSTCAPIRRHRRATRARSVACAARRSRAGPARAGRVVRLRAGRACDRRSTGQRKSRDDDDRAAGRSCRRADRRSSARGHRVALPDARCARRGRLAKVGMPGKRVAALQGVAQAVASGACRSTACVGDVERHARGVARAARHRPVDSRIHRDAGVARCRCMARRDLVLMQSIAARDPSLGGRPRNSRAPKRGVHGAPTRPCICGTKSRTARAARAAARRHTRQWRRARIAR